MTPPRTGSAGVGTSFSAVALFAAAVFSTAAAALAIVAAISASTASSSSDASFFGSSTLCPGGGPDGGAGFVLTTLSTSGLPAPRCQVSFNTKLTCAS